MLMDAYFGLGSNLGDRLVNLSTGIARLRSYGLKIRALSPVVESPALLPPGANPHWNTPYLNLAIKAEVTGPPTQWLEPIRIIEDQLGRKRLSRWAPRPLDIDILLWGDETWALDDLKIPHPNLGERHFAITPLLHLTPHLIVANTKKTIFDLSQQVNPLPLWMAIINLTPDSFSDGGHYAHLDDLQAEVTQLLSAGVHFLDLGAESTRPDAQPISPEEEWQRLEPGLRAVSEVIRGRPFAPRISVDTRHARVAAQALEQGAQFINDVSGLDSSEMRAVARASDCDWVVMHHLGLPTRREYTLPREIDPVVSLTTWLHHRLAQLEDEGIDPARLVFDPGIGFGKDSLQSLILLQRIKELRALGLRVLIGHSRKSFMRQFTTLDPHCGDIETIGVSLRLCQSGVDILRVHNVPEHVRAYRAWSHIEGFGYD